MTNTRLFLDEPVVIDAAMRANLDEFAGRDPLVRVRDALDHRARLQAAHGRPGLALVVVVDLEENVSRNDQEHRARLNQRLRQAFLEGAEDDSWRRLGRGLTRKELERVLWHYPATSGRDGALTPAPAPHGSPACTAAAPVPKS